LGVIDKLNSTFANKKINAIETGDYSERCHTLKKMTDNKDKINQLLDKLETLLKRQDDFSREINSLRIEINRLNASEIRETSEKEEIKVDGPVADTEFEIEKEKVTVDYQTNYVKAIWNKLYQSTIKGVFLTSVLGTFHLYSLS